MCVDARVYHSTAIHIGIAKPVINLLKPIYLYVYLSISKFTTIRHTSHTLSYTHTRARAYSSLLRSHENEVKPYQFCLLAFSLLFSLCNRVGFDISHIDECESVSVCMCVCVRVSAATTVQPLC